MLMIVCEVSERGFAVDAETEGAVVFSSQPNNGWVTFGETRDQGTLLVRKRPASAIALSRCCT
jgi:hypothetical protein